MASKTTTKKPKNRARYFSWRLIKAGRVWANCQCDCGSQRRFKLTTWNAGKHLSFHCFDCSLRKSNKVHTWLFYKPARAEQRDDV